MQTWMQAILVAAAAVTALGVLWTKALRPLVQFVSLVGESLPYLRELAVAFRGTPNPFAVLQEIVEQVRTDSGSSLLDMVMRIETASQEAATTARNLEVGVESAKQLAQQDREEVRDLMLKLDRLTVKVTDNAESIAARAEVVADNLVEAKRMVEGVAADLDEAHTRADEAEGPHGAAADAAAQNPSE